MSDSLLQESAEDERRKVDFDLPCLRCGYNLRTLRVDGVCPECGESVAPSVEVGATPQRRSALGEISSGARLLAWSIPILGAGAAVDVAIGQLFLSPLLLILPVVQEIALLQHLRTILPGTPFRSSVLLGVLGLAFGLLLFDPTLGSGSASLPLLGTGLLLCFVMIQLRVLRGIRGLSEKLGAPPIARLCASLRISGLVLVWCGYLVVALTQFQRFGSPTFDIAWTLSLIFAPVSVILFFAVMLSLARRLKVYRFSNERGDAERPARRGRP